MQDTIIRRALDLISAADTLAFPINTRRIAEHFRYEMRYYGHSRELLNTFNLTDWSKKYRAISTRRHGKCYIFLSDDLSVAQETREIAHELGHIALGHLETDTPLLPEGESEEQAELFALALLAPPPLLDAHDVSCPEDIHRITGMSLTDSRQAFALYQHYRLRQQDAAVATAIAQRARVALQPPARGDSPDTVVYVQNLLAAAPQKAVNA